MTVCVICKKYKFLLIECKCGNNYCTYHILPEKHKCEKLFDFHRKDKELNTENLLNCAVKPVLDIFK